MPSQVCSHLSTAYPELLLQAYAACQRKDWDAATALQREINEKLDQFVQVPARRTGDVLLELAREHGGSRPHMGQGTSYAPSMKGPHTATAAFWTNRVSRR